MTNNIKRVRSTIQRATNDIIAQLDFITSSIETEYDDDTMFYADIETYDYDDYFQVELTNLLVVREGKLFENISSAVANEVDKAIDNLNQDAKERALNWDYQKEYETIGGKYAYL